MKNRIRSYGVLLLVASLLTLLPAAMYPDMVLPMEDNWENWYWQGQPHPRPEFSMQRQPRLFRMEVALYKALVTPPALARRAIVGWPTSYGFFLSPHRETSGFPPLAETLEHTLWSIPVWLGFLLAAYEAVKLGAKILAQRTAG